jgi:mono/diheme cytochrome c family protein
MNTSKQVNVMIGLLFLAFIAFAGYIAYEPGRASSAEEAQRDMYAERGAHLYILNCANCHGIEGLGPEEGALGFQLQRDAFRIVRADNPYGAEETPFGEAEEVREFLFNSIACGRTGTAMPPWHERYGGPLSEIQVNYIVTMITEGRWDLVAGEWEHYLEDERKADSPEVRQDYLITDPGALSITRGNCGQYGAVERQEFLARNPLAGPDATPPPDATPDPDAGPEGQIVQGVLVGDYYRSTCAGCHGQQREGGVGPPLTPDHFTQDPSFYADTIRNGRPGTAMPPWGGGVPLSDEELDALVTYLMEVQP